MNGSISASSWWRNADSESSTPARKAPIAIDRPPHCITSAAPSTTISDAASMISRPPSLATKREQWVEQPAPREDHGEQRHKPHRRAEPNRLLRIRSRAVERREHRHQRQQRHDREVFEQQDGNGALARRCRGFPALVEHLHDDRSRRQHEAHRTDDGHRDREPAEIDADRGQQRAAGQHLHEPQPEDVAPQRPQLRRLHFEADDEEEHHDAKFGHVQNGHGIRDQADTERPDDEPRRQVAEDGAEPELAEQRHRHHARGEKGHGMVEADKRRVSIHGSVVSGSKEQVPCVEGISFD